MTARLLILVALALGLLGAPAAAQRDDPPFWATLDAEKVNMRVGPSRDYRIMWVYRRDGLPVKVLRVAEGWWLVREADGTEGWVNRALLSRARGALVTEGEPAEMRAEPSDAAALNWLAEPGVVGRLGECEADFCEFDVMGRIGWVRASRLWGAGEP